MATQRSKDWTSCDLAMRIALLQRVSVRMLMETFGISRAGAYRWINRWCRLHDVPGPRDLPISRFYLSPISSLDTIYSRDDRWPDQAQHLSQATCAQVSP